MVAALRGSCAASLAGPKAGVAEEATTRGFAAPAFAGCAFIEVCATVGRGTLPVKLICLCGVGSLAYPPA
jgi:hypothetical protein